MRKLLIIIGAGASQEFGMPSVIKIDEFLKEIAQNEMQLIDEPDKNLYSWVHEMLRNYRLQNIRNRIDETTNFESVLFTIQYISSLLTDREWQNFNNLISPFINLIDFPKISRFKKIQSASGSDFSYLHSFLVDKLLSSIRIKCKDLSTTRHNELNLLADFFSVLKKDFNLGVINLNYDNVILSALPDLNTGFDLFSGEFSREKLYNSSAWNFCYHIHGSVHFDMKGGKDTEMHKIFWNSDLSSRFSQNSSGRNSIYTSEGIHHLNSSIITGLDKSNQILREPFTSYFMQLDRAVYDSDSILFIGYGFKDLHLNRIFPFIRYDNSKNRKVVIIDFAENSEDGLQFRNDSWSFGIRETIPFNGIEMGDGKNREPHATGYFKKNKIFEKSSNSNYPLAIWYGGLLDACQNADKILEELK
jgi:hypothetical protein